MYHKNFKHLPWTESIEVAGPIIGVFIPKNHLFRVFFVVFWGTAHELMVPAEPPITHLRPHVMQKEPIVLLNLPRRGKISGIINVTLYCKIDTVIQLFRWIYKWSLEKGLYKTLDPLLLYQIEPYISTPEKSAFCTRPFVHISNTRCCALSDNIKKHRHEKNLGD